MRATYILLAFEVFFINVLAGDCLHIKSSPVFGKFMGNGTSEIDVITADCCAANFVQSVLKALNMTVPPANIKSGCLNNTKITRSNQGELMLLRKPGKLQIITAVLELLRYWMWRNATWVIDENTDIDIGIIVGTLREENWDGNVMEINDEIARTFLTEIMKNKTGMFVVIVGQENLISILNQLSLIEDQWIKLPSWIIVSTDWPSEIYPRKRTSLSTQFTLIAPPKQKQVMIYLGNGTFPYHKNHSIPTPDDDTFHYYDVLFSGKTKRMEYIKFAFWDHEKGLQILEKFAPEDEENKLLHRAVTAISFLDEPYVSIARPPKHLGNEGAKMLTGYFPCVISDAMEHLLAAFISLKAPETEFGLHVNGSWKGVVGSLHKRKYDFTLVKLGMTSDRLGVVRFLPPLVRGEAKLLVRRPSEFIIYSYYLRPLHLNVWLVLLCTIISMVAVLGVGKSIQESNSLQVSFCRRFILAVQDDVPCRWVSNRIWTTTLLLTLYLVSCYYHCVFTASRTVRNERLPFENLHELAADKEYSVTFARSLYYADIFKVPITFIRLLWSKPCELNAKWFPMDAIWRKICQNNMADLVENITDGRDKAYSGKFALLADRLTANFHFKRNCSFVALKGSYMKEFYHIAVRPDYPFNKIVALLILKMKENGLLNRFQMIFLRKRSTFECDKESTSLEIKDVFFLFLFLFSGCFISIVVAIFEFAYYNSI